jgi:uncharacterized protein affecting Mg2+/Co2+ transport
VIPRRVVKVIKKTEPFQINEAKYTDVKQVVPVVDDNNILGELDHLKRDDDYFYTNISDIIEQSDIMKGKMDQSFKEEVLLMENRAPNWTMDMPKIQYEENNESLSLEMCLNY